MSAGPCHHAGRRDDDPPEDLFGTDFAVVPALLAGETLYSWCARFHRLSCNSSASSTSRQLFGHPSAGLQHDFPTHLDHFQMVTRDLTGSVSDVIYGRTQFPLYAPFLDEELRRAAIDAMRGNGRASIAQRMGLTRSGLGPIAPLKACRQCSDLDRLRIPSAWWHVEHQWDPVRVCPRHGEILLVAAEQLHVRGLKDWYLPRDLRVDQWQVEPVLGPDQLYQLTRIANWTLALVGERERRYSGALLRQTYLLEAKTHGWIAMDGSLRFIALRDAFMETYRGLDFLHGLSFLARAQGVNGGLLGLLLRGYPGARHPIKHIYMMAFLFPQPDDFFARYAEVASIAETEGPEGLAQQLTDVRGRLRHKVVVEGMSVNSASRELGIPTAQAIRHLKKEGSPYGTRPRVLAPGVKERLDALLNAGEERRQIAAMLGIRTNFIKDYLAGHPDLRRAWEREYEAKRRNQYREHFLKVLQDNPGVPIKRIRRISRNGFEWLYRNDLEWLKEHLPGIWHRVSQECF